ncbi:T9SS type A sorting domain-containing protein [Saccharicrinis aurantiacus]|uniref:T9SS type A sorting domain-containing protein n=1 Tax=Saccharicrinis aurantiacus TaxID=1849719 RepID=UPI002491ACEB|nr:T9SS type A sorting domain-containing protein [Saccharicrinis aurantiacus]
MKKQLHFYLIAIMLTFGFNVGAQNLIDDNFYSFEVRNDGNAFDTDSDAGQTGKWGTKISTITLDANFTIVETMSVSGDNSLKYEIQSTETTNTIYTVRDNDYTSGTPVSTLTAIVGGTYDVNMKVFIDGTVTAGTFQLRINDGTSNTTILPFAFADLETGKWVEVSHEVDLSDLSANGDANLQVRMVKVSGTGSIYLDDIVITEAALEYDVDFLVKNESGSAIKSANITVDDATYSTDDNGLVTVSMYEGDNSVVIARTGYAMDYQVINVPVAGAVDVVLKSAASAQIVVNATDASDQVLGGKLVIAKDINDKTVFAKATNNAAGRAWIAGLEAGTYTYEFQGTNTLTGTTEFTARNRNLMIKEGGYNINLAVVADNDLNTDITDATVVLTDGAGGSVALTQNNSEFYYQGNSVTSGTFNYAVNALGYKEATGSFVLTDINNIDLRYIKLEETSTNIGNPSDFEHAVYPNPATSVVNVAAPAGSVVSFYSISGNKAKVINTTSELTSISVTDLAKGLYILEIVSEGSKIIEKIQIQ